MKLSIPIRICLSIFALLLAGSPFARASSEAEALKDWNALQSSIEALNTQMDGVVPQYAPNIIGSDSDAMLARLAEYDKNLKRTLTAQLEQFVKKYGDTSAMDNKLSSMIAIDWRSGKHPTTQASQLYATLEKYMENIEQARQNKSEELMREAEELQSSIQRWSSWVTDENFDKLESLLKAALGFNPGNETAKKWLAGLGKERREAKAAVEKKINEAKWPGHSANFSGPGNPDELAKSALEWLQKDEKEAGRRDRTFAVAVRGDWVSAKKNLLGQTVQWGLPIWAACYFEEEQAQGICRVFALTILTQAGGPDIKQAPPWTYTWVGDNYTMRIKNVKGGVVSGRSARGGRAQRGMASGAFRLLLALGNVAAGLLAAAPLLKTKVSALEAVYAKTDSHRPVIGIAALGIALLALLRNLFRLALLADLLPILALLTAGLLLGGNLLISKLAGTKAGALAAAQESRIAALGKIQVPLGIACMALGILHLLAGGLPLL